MGALRQRRVYRLDEDGNRIMGEDGKPLFDAVPTTDWEARKRWSVGGRRGPLWSMPSLRKRG